MAALSDMLAGGKPDEGGGDGGEPDYRKLAEESLKAMFEAGKSGDWSSAYEHFSSAVENCEKHEEQEGGDEEEGEEGEAPGYGHDAPPHHALLLIPHGKAS
jgi:hypothetical protein